MPKQSKKYWFRTKLYGWGWVPSTWQGWLVLAIYLFLVTWDFGQIDSHSHSVSDTLINYVPNTVFFTLILIFICFKTGEKPRWRWGK